MAHPNENLARKGYAAFGGGDLPTLNDMFADDIVWHVGGRSSRSGDYRGKGAVFAFFAKSMEVSGGTFRITPRVILANDEHVVALVTVSGSRKGKAIQDNGVQVLRVADGKVLEAWYHPADAYAVDEFWS
jgi:ketosteroid isomerase-like protein